MRDEPKHRLETMFAPNKISIRIYILPNVCKPKSFQLKIPSRKNKTTCGAIFFRLKHILETSRNLEQGILRKVDQCELHL